MEIPCSAAHSKVTARPPLAHCGCRPVGPWRLTHEHRRRAEAEPPAESAAPAVPVRRQVLQDEVPPHPYGELTGRAVEGLHQGGVPRVAMLDHVLLHHQVRELSCIVALSLLFPAHCGVPGPGGGGARGPRESALHAGSGDSAPRKRSARGCVRGSGSRGAAGPNPQAGSRVTPLQTLRQRRVSQRG